MINCSIVSNSDSHIGDQRPSLNCTCIVSDSTCQGKRPSLRSIIFTGKCLKMLKFRPQLLAKNDNYFFVLLNFDHLKK